MELLFLAIVGILLIVAIRQTSVVTGAIVALVIAIVSVALSWAAFHYERWLVDPISPLMAALAVYLAGSLLGYMRTEADRRRNRLVLAQYLPPRLVDRYARDMGALRLGGETRELTVLFTDIRGFTAIAERLAPEALTRLVNGFLTPMTRIVQEETGGTVDKYIGDCLMAFWNAPEDDPDRRPRAPGRAVDARRARATRGRAAEAHPPAPRSTAAHRHRHQHRPLPVGNFGSERASIFGDRHSVNLASRLGPVAFCRCRCRR
jgi:adenylate cyclase